MYGWVGVHPLFFYSSAPLIFHTIIFLHVYSPYIFYLQMHERLLKLDPQNEKTLSTIQESLFAICLESYATSDDVDVSHRVFFHGMKGRNRWFDKSLSFIFMNNGRAGCNGEHSPSDAIIPGEIIGTCLKG